MKKNIMILLVVVLLVLSAGSALAWLPKGWVCHTGAYAYSIRDNGWYYFNPADEQQIVDMTSGVWTKLASATGWFYYEWAYAYSIDKGSWCWFNTANKQWCCKMGNGQWSKMGSFVKMMRVPGGTYNMGDSFSEGDNNERPVHSVSVNTFYMDRFEVTNDKMVEILNWAYGQGKISISSVGSVRNTDGDSRELVDLDVPYCGITWNGSQFDMKAIRGSAYPCVEVTWYGAAAFCNYRSQQEGLTACYNLSDWSCNFNANGYRLPTEAEWERAARGGLSGQRFPFGNFINHDYANYYANGASYTYDTSPYTTNTYHTSWNWGDKPYTSIVDTFPEWQNAYGLYDMAGNVWEWCNDWYSSNYYASSSVNNPSGPASGTKKVLRGGCWGHTAFTCRVTARDFQTPNMSDSGRGFRCVRR